MNGRPLGLAEAEGLSTSKDEDAKARTMDDDVRKAWAAALAASIPAEPPARAAGAADAASTAGWRPSDVSMTEFSDELTRAGGQPVAESSEPVVAIATRLETVVNTGALGRVSFIVDRSNAGLSIVVEVGNDAAAGAVDAERLTLLRTLRVAGLTVLSFRILVRNGSGTTLADEPEGQHGKDVLSPRARYGRATRVEDDDPERVDVVG
jgi:hypothetical protein